MKPKSKVILGITTVIGLAVAGYFIWKNRNKNTPSVKAGGKTGNTSFSGGEDFFMNADGNRNFRNGGYYSFVPKNPDGYYPISPKTKSLGLNKDRTNTVTLKITNQVNGRYYDFNTAKSMGYTNEGLSEGIIVLAFPVKFKGLIVPVKDFNRASS